MYDIIIIGAGPGGYVMAERAGKRGKKVLLIEKEQLGGVCLNRGCIPTKTLINSAKHYVHAIEAPAFGVTTGEVEIMCSWMVIERLNVFLLRISPRTSML